jgi:hypothetical protein
VDSRSWKRYGTAAGLVASGAVAGGILAATLSANADPRTSDDSSTSQFDRDGSHRDEELLTGDTKARVERAVLAEYPGASIRRTETDSEGVYESHIVTTGGERLTVQVDEDFTVTDTDSDGRRGDRDRDDD